MVHEYDDVGLLCLDNVTNIREIDLTVQLHMTSSDIGNEEYVSINPSAM